MNSACEKKDPIQSVETYATEKVSQQFSTSKETNAEFPYWLEGASVV